MLGRGLRFNNPFRLSTELGGTAESVSLTAPYLDLSVGFVVGPAAGLAHGGAVHLSTALSGIAQEVVSASYLMSIRLPPRWLVTGRAGMPLVFQPDANLGVEAAASGTFLLTAAIGVGVEIDATLFYGAATGDTPATAIPILSLQAGATFAYEVLP